MKIIGHRGARGLAPENTASSIGHALTHRVDEVEFDVRVTKDNVAVLIHDSALRIGGESFAVAVHTYKELKKLKADLATLDEALKMIGTKARPHIEVKPGEPITPIVTVLKSHLADSEYDPAHLLLGSKSQKTLRALHRELPEIEKVVIEAWSGTRAVVHARQVGTRRLSMRSTWLWAGFLRHMQRRGWLITPYTMNNPAAVKKWQPYIYGVITDYPDLFED